MKRLLLFILICICVTYDFASFLKTTHDIRAAEQEQSELRKQARMIIQCRASKGYGKECE